MEKTFEMQVSAVDADTVTLIRNVRYGVTDAVGESPDLTNIVLEYGAARDALLFPLATGEYTVTIKRKV